MHAAAARPWLILVTGEPGSGKTSLGVRLAEALRLPFFTRDQVRGGMLGTAGLWTNDLHDTPPREAAVDALVDIVEAAARRGVSLVLELVVTPERRDALRRIEAAANCLVVLTNARDAAARAERRDRVDPLLSRPNVLSALGQDSMDAFLRSPLREAVRSTTQADFDLPTLRVSTDDGYAPHVGQVVDWIVEQTTR